MKWIDTIDIRNWANRRDCQRTLPLLIRKLIRATSNSIQSIKFPSGEKVQTWRMGCILEVREKTEYLPEGISLWEFGANKDIKRKADDDYTKRSTNPLNFNQKDATFVFVTHGFGKKGKNGSQKKRRMAFGKIL